ncbi:MAG: HTH-type transcriptional repressor AseR [Syntrophus sp. PtaB.Bin138]|jgi:ArsR family transcriptional regulator|nr:metalloregulator ArsR/SmtB family transcription factor [Syntrophus sp. (in: bacteria)]OPY13989.1 MAG: HTH-type transcriptional repressor AseR [Syntrophus sp. PtaB.Bin138]
MRDFLKVTKALSDPNRIKILKMLQHKVMCVCEIETALSIAQPTASKHLKMLEDSGMIRSMREGQWVNYYPSDGRESPYAATLLGNLRHWLEDDPEVQRLIERIPSIRREEISCHKKKSREDK